MTKKKEKGFTLIELVAVLVIMAILALIVTPLVMNIIRKSRIAADKRSIDAYGRSIELAIAGYLLDNGKFPTDVSQLTIEYSGNKVECSTTQLNPDSSVYLTGCTVGGRTVDYTYGGDKSPSYTAYAVGNQLTYNGVDYYVIKDSGVKESTVTLLKATPLTVDEVNLYGGEGTSNNHVNMYVTSNTNSEYYQTAYDYNGYGGMAYYSSPTCGDNGTDRVETGCTTNYAQSEVKYAVDAWRTAKAPAATEARLITLDDLTDNLGIELNRINSTSYQIVQTEDTPAWVMGENYQYWTMTTNTDKTADIWLVSSTHVVSNTVLGSEADGIYGAVRPVITISKSVLSN